MTSKKPAASKRASLPRASDYTKDFLKDWQRLSHSGRYDMNRLKEAMTLLTANNGPLPPEWLDHPLTGEWVNHRECHIGGDFLLRCWQVWNGSFRSKWNPFRVVCLTHFGLYLTTPAPSQPLPAPHPLRQQLHSQRCLALAPPVGQTVPHGPAWT